MGLARRARGGVVEAAGIGLGERNERAERGGGDLLGIDDEQERPLADERNRREIARRVIRQLGIGGGNDRVARGNDQERVAVGRRFGHRVGADDAARGG